MYSIFHCKAQDSVPARVWHVSKWVTDFTRSTLSTMKIILPKYTFGNVPHPNDDSQVQHISVTVVMYRTVDTVQYHSHIWAKFHFLTATFERVSLFAWVDLLPSVCVLHSIIVISSPQSYCHPHRPWTHAGERGPETLHEGAHQQVRGPTVSAH